MKFYIKSFIIACLLLGATTTTHAQPGVNVSFQVFYTNLSPYGQWVDDPQYGYVWVPYVDPGFRPYYTNGYWVMTEYGNTWVSGYSWGWACFHYGRWIYDPYYGWVWVPGMEWAPAWVAWRYGYGYYGWAPLTPGFVIGVSFANYYCPNNWWIFIPPHYLHHRHFHQYWKPRNNGTIINRTRLLTNTRTNDRNNIRYVPGPTQTELRKETNQTVPVYRIENSSRPEMTNVSGNTVRIYNPMTIQRTNADNNNPQPANYLRAPQPISKPEAVSNNSSVPVFRREHPLPQQPSTPVQRAEPGQPPVQRTEPARPTQPPVQRTEPARPIQPQRTEPQRPTQPPVQRTEPARPVQPPVQRTQPARPAQPPVQRTQPVRPTQPTTPSHSEPQTQPSRSTPQQRNIPHRP